MIYCYDGDVFMVSWWFKSLDIGQNIIDLFKQRKKIQNDHMRLANTKICELGEILVPVGNDGIIKGSCVDGTFTFTSIYNPIKLPPIKDTLIRSEFNGFKMGAQELYVLVYDYDNKLYFIFSQTFGNRPLYQLLRYGENAQGKMHVDPHFTAAINRIRMMELETKFKIERQRIIDNSRLKAIRLEKLKQNKDMLASLEDIEEEIDYEKFKKEQEEKEKNEENRKHFAKLNQMIEDRNRQIRETQEKWQSEDLARKQAKLTLEQANRRNEEKYNEEQEKKRFEQKISELWLTIVQPEHNKEYELLEELDALEKEKQRLLSKVKNIKKVEKKDEDIAAARLSLDFVYLQGLYHIKNVGIDYSYKLKMNNGIYELIDYREERGQLHPIFSNSWYSPFFGGCKN